jgi:hypothetical protein
MIDAAKQAMRDAFEATGNLFFDHTLRIPLCKSDWPPITIVDLLGVIHTKIQGITQDLISLDREVVGSHIASPRRIILVSARKVLPCWIIRGFLNIIGSIERICGGMEQIRNHVGGCSGLRAHKVTITLAECRMQIGILAAPV